MSSPYYQEEIRKIRGVINNALATYFGADKFSEYPPVGGLAVIASPRRWKRIDPDQVEQPGTIWVVGGWNTLAECHAGLDILSAKMEIVEVRVIEAITAELKPFMQPRFAIDTEAGWEYEVEGKQNDAKQQAPWTGQIRVPYVSVLPVRAGVLSQPQVAVP